MEGIVAAIVGMASSLGIGVIAEGVEFENQINFLLRQGCLQCQGYLFSKPLRADEILVLLKNGGFARPKQLDTVPVSEPVPS